ncbi:MAG TPA: N-acetyl-gamma-glutamyl-phosphate reductase [Bacillales bacterium]|nr:N-acetyl-gamma-glutamyl-phosphate reductase [Bacillales bacterium]
MQIGIVGATGYGGAELLRVLHRHPETEMLHLYSSSQAGEDVRVVFPHLGRLGKVELEPIEPVVMAGKLDVVFIAAPPGVSAELTPLLVEKGLRVIDLSGDFRLRDPHIYETWYGRKTAAKKWLDHAVYGLTEWNKPSIAEAACVANPGCFPTASLLGLLPLVKRRYVNPESIIIDAKTGVSGAGRGLSSAVHFSETNENLSIYKVNSHKHTPEIEQVLHDHNDDVAAVTFSPHLVPMTRGILATIYGTVSPGVTPEALREAFLESYTSCTFVTIREQDRFPSTKEVYGSNQCDIGLAFDERTKRVTVVSAIDNLMKGAAGQAVQNMNVMFGFDESAGLEALPVFP